jgi:hypothetical protein
MTVTDTTAAPSFADLSRDLLETADLEVITSLVELPPSFQAPPHLHPGDSEGAKLIVFRVHTPGVPERELVDIEA